MMPRGEVALVVAGIGLAKGAIDTPLFGIAVMIAVFTTVVTPFPLIRAFNLKGWGTRAQFAERVQAGVVHSFLLPRGLATLYERHLVATMGEHGYQPGGSWTDAHGTRGLELVRHGQIVSLVIRDTPDARRVDLESETQVAEIETILADAAGRTGAEVSAALDAART